LLRSQNIHSDGLRLDEVAFISEDIHNSMSNSKVEVGDVLLNITGASIGRCYYFDGQFQEANVNQHVCILRPNEKVLTKYLYLLLISNLGQNQISINQVGGGREGLNSEELKSFTFPLPPLKEQKTIVDFLQQETDKIDKIKYATILSIELIKERRTALITATVTGQIEIP
jgi:type I restriction enzyme, S subunit